jgi:hypothetical protein
MPPCRSIHARPANGIGVPDFGFFCTRFSDVCLKKHFAQPAGYREPISIRNASCLIVDVRCKLREPEISWNPCGTAELAKLLNSTKIECIQPLGLERVAGIEPAYSAWKAAALPLSYTRIHDPATVVEGVGFEPT